jgi:glutathione S-transferase
MDSAEIKSLLDQIDAVKLDNANLEAELQITNYSGPKLKLTYFETRGRAELTRIVFAAGGIPYEERNASYPDHAKMKESGEALFGQLPVLEVDGVTFGQSYSIAKFVAKLGGLHKSDPLEALGVEQIVDTSDDIRSKYVPIRYQKVEDSEKLEKYNTFFTATLPPLLDNLERVLGGKDFYVGSGITVADIAIMNVVDQLTLPNCPVQLGDAAARALNENFLPASRYPGLVALCARVKAAPKIAAYLAKRRPAVHGMGYSD